MSYLFGFGLLVVAGAVVVLFAMLGELYARSGGMEGAGAPGGGSGTVRLLRRSPRRVAAEALARRSGGGRHGGPAGGAGVQHLLQQLREGGRRGRRPGRQRDFAVLISTIDQERGEDFMSRHELAGLPHHIDVGGEWVAEELGVMTSPSALVFRHGRLVSALLFTDMAALSGAVFPVKEAVGNE